MKFLRYALLLWAAIPLSGFSPQLAAQTPTDAIMMDGGVICVAGVYSHDAWKEYWEGTLKRDNGNIGTLTRQGATAMFSLGIKDRLNVLGALPWMKTEASAGQVRGAQGFQDAGLWVKWQAVKQRAGNGDFTAYAVLGATLPVSNYLEDFAPFSLGLGCAEGSLRGIVQYKMDKGPYLRALAAYHLRGNAKIERNYYYTTHGVYTDEVDMPDAVSYGGVLGSWFFKDALKVEATFEGLNTLGGFDIRRQDAGFPANKMIFTRVGGGFHYYFPQVTGLGVFAYYNRILSGRNVGQSTSLSGGVTYFFNVWGK